MGFIRKPPQAEPKGGLGGKNPGDWQRRRQQCDADTRYFPRIQGTVKLSILDNRPF
jgi:hypothetical protein